MVYLSALRDVCGVFVGKYIVHTYVMSSVRELCFAGVHQYVKFCNTLFACRAREVCLWGTCEWRLTAGTRRIPLWLRIIPKITYIIVICAHTCVLHLHSGDSGTERHLHGIYIMCRTRKHRVTKGRDVWLGASASLLSPPLQNRSAVPDRSNGCALPTLG